MYLEDVVTPQELDLQKDLRGVREVKNFQLNIKTKIFSHMYTDLKNIKFFSDFYAHYYESRQ